ncbi:bifunctional hydroxymethylpyrimidine kinase/phosphomethylpyrimidine kinase [Hyphobacterium marinum]|uniref:pyridoxal kinase n=1 Tax=Hyphobacterium marinum TaxID=3116574 RepID=A0ABU7LWC0_9PROT|nr:bifunctional hydroxymethylpyrimidine kinase/phosphomethylpyrimidine kinase [Hyphobacterium sp. Y6023]MEE2565577.1 bifunctional hydroxymethylpyrimidine kinase/phosphomethylpyrimidine kinase [Hyphobacterium sp. Y6023]
MAFVLLLTSHVAASRVGGGVAESALQSHGIDTALVPTVILGRHPGWGAPGGGAVDDAMFSSALDGVAANGMFALTDAVLTGYFASAAQVDRAAAAIDAVRAATTRKAHNVCAYAPEPVIVVDPIMGDHGKLYVPDPVASAIRHQLIPRADLVTPNAWELGWLTGKPVTDAQLALAAARSLKRPVLVSSVPKGDEIGILHADAHSACFVSHPVLEDVPKGTGDLLTAEFLASRLLGADPKTALEVAVRRVWDTLLKARDWSAFELPDVTARLKPMMPQAAGLEARALEG